MFFGVSISKICCGIATGELNFGLKQNRESVAGRGFLLSEWLGCACAEEEPFYCGAGAAGGLPPCGAVVGAAVCVALFLRFSTPFLTPPAAAPMAAPLPASPAIAPIAAPAAAPRAPPLSTSPFGWVADSACAEPNAKMNESPTTAEAIFLIFLFMVLLDLLEGLRKSRVSKDGFSSSNHYFHLPRFPNLGV